MQLNGAWLQTLKLSASTQSKPCNITGFISMLASVTCSAHFITWKLCVIAKLQSILLLEGRKHDAGILTDSQLLRDLGQYAFSPTGVPLCVYGDPAYPLRIHLQGPFKHGILTPNMELYNTKMSAVRSSVEWLFGDVINSFKFNDFKKNLKLFQNSVGKMYVVAVILRNAITCLYGNMTSEFFDLRPPALDTYFT